MKNIQDLTLEELIDLGDFATIGCLKSEFSKNIKEITYDKEVFCDKRGLEFELHYEDGYSEKHYFEIDASKKDGLPWMFSWLQDDFGLSPLYNITKIVDYCRENHINIENN